jgi:hypothetical protein
MKIKTGVKAGAGQIRDRYRGCWVDNKPPRYGTCQN